MDFRAAHQHPFTPAEAAQLDVGTIVGEINRLRNSLAHLSRTQDELSSFLADEDDADLRTAFEENASVIASQTERVALLRAVLIDKVGPDSLAHYGLEDGAQTAAQPDVPSTMGDPRTASGQTNTAANGRAENGNNREESRGAVEADDGLYL